VFYDLRVFFVLAAKFIRFYFGKFMTILPFFSTMRMAERRQFNSIHVERNLLASIKAILYECCWKTLRFSALKIRQLGVCDELKKVQSY
jgi:hypothetical protein